MKSKPSPFIILFMFNHFQVIWQHHVPVNEIYNMFSVSHLKIVTVTLVYFERIKKGFGGKMRRLFH